MEIKDTLFQENTDKFNYAIEYFNRISVEENIEDPKNGDTLFERYGVGNTLKYIDRPFERLNYYEELLLKLKGLDNEKYNNLHKGTPFYYMAWQAFDQKNFNKGLYYIDAAIAEDIKHRPNSWKNGVAIQFYTLEQPNIYSTRTVNKISSILNKYFNKFKEENQNVQLTNECFSKYFLHTILNDDNVAKRSIISSFYVFLLEYDDLYNSLEIRTAHKGSTLPFISHLFNGTVLFETLLKEFYKFNENGGSLLTLNSIYKSNEFQNDFGLLNINTSAVSLNDILSGLVLDTSFLGYFSATSKLRNTTGHSVVWDDVFDDPSNYKLFFESIVYSIFYIIVVKYVGKSI